jgi:hypothetical protein
MLKFLFILLLIGLGLRYLFKLLFDLFFRPLNDGYRNGSSEDRRREGEVRVEKNPKNEGSNSGRKVGEYVDFEEIQ